MRRAARTVIADRYTHMTSQRRARAWASLAAASALAMTFFGTALGQPPPGRPSAPAGRAGSPPHQHFDGRFSNNHYYYNRGYSVRRPPPGSVGELRGPRGGRYWYHRGDWYRWRDGSWVVWGAPVGVFVPWLPPHFTTIWWYGIPYYYANDTYYIWDADRDRYQVVAPPAEVDQTATTQAPPSDRLFVYPQKGQSAEQRSKDEFECHRWSVTKSGFDPTQPGGGVPAAQLVQKRNDYFRADAACLEGRGYTVR